jgi:hypothetical protein
MPSPAKTSPSPSGARASPRLLTKTAAEEEAVVHAFLVERLAQRFEREHGRAPTAEESASLRATLDEAHDFADAEGAASEADAENFVLEKLCDTFVALNKRAPTEVELQGVLKKMRLAAPQFQSAMGGDEEAAVHKFLIERTCSRFQAAHGREPTAKEREELAASLREEVAMDGDGDDEAEGAGRGIVLEGVCDAFQAAHGREPTDEDLQNILTNISAAAPALKAAQREGAPAEQEKEAAEQSAQGEAAPAEGEAAPAEGEAGDVLAQLIALFKEQNGKEPTEEHLKQWIKTISEVAAEPQQLEEGEDDEQEAAASKGKKRAAAPAEAPPAPLDLGLTGLLQAPKRSKQ